MNPSLHEPNLRNLCVWPLRWQVCWSRRLWLAEQFRPQENFLAFRLVVVLRKSRLCPRRLCWPASRPSRTFVASRAFREVENLTCNSANHVPCSIIVVQTKTAAKKYPCNVNKNENTDSGIISSLHGLEWWARNKLYSAELTSQTFMKSERLGIQFHHGLELWQKRTSSWSKGGLHCAAELPLTLPQLLQLRPELAEAAEHARGARIWVLDFRIESVGRVGFAI